MKGMVMAAGIGTRLRPLTETTPKPLLPVGPWPIMRYGLERLKAAGIRDVVVNLHHLPEQIPRAFEDGSDLGMRITYSMEPEILGTGGGISKVRDFFGDEPFVVINGDTIFDVDLEGAFDLHRSIGATATMVVRDVPDATRWGAVEIDGARRVRRILGEPEGAGAGEALRAVMFAGVQVLEPKVFAYMPEAGPFSMTQVIYPRMLEAGEPVAAYVADGCWYDVGTPARYEEAQRDIVEGRARLRFIHPPSEASDP